MNRSQIHASNLLMLLLIAAALFTSSSAMPEMEDFAPLQCNIDAAIDSDECLSNAVGFSTLFLEGESAPLTIPCGKCVFMDYIDGSTITVSGGLNVIGRLHFPPTANVVLRTTAVYVQGAWSMGIPEEGNTVKVSLYGSGEKTFYPHTSCCENNGIDNIYGYDCTCSMPEGIGKLPFVVAGGKARVMNLHMIYHALNPLQFHLTHLFSLPLFVFSECVQTNQQANSISVPSTIAVPLGPSSTRSSLWNRSRLIQPLRVVFDPAMNCSSHRTKGHSALIRKSSLIRWTNQQARWFYKQQCPVSFPLKLRAKNPSLRQK